MLRFSQGEVGGTKLTKQRGPAQRKIYGGAKQQSRLSTRVQIGKKCGRETLTKRMHANYNFKYLTQQEKEERKHSFHYM